MTVLKQLMSELEKKGSETRRKIYARHGIDLPMFGVSVADLKTIAKKIKGDQRIALELYDTGNYDAMYLAGIVVDGSQMNKKQLESWAKSASCEALAAYVIPWVAVETPHARELALKWIGSKNECLAVSGWGTYSGIVAIMPDEYLDLAEIQSLLDRVAGQVHQAPNKVRYMMNGFVIAVGSYVKPLLKQAKQAAKAIGTVTVDMGDTACKVPLATQYIAKVEAVRGIGKKRKTLRC